MTTEKFRNRYRIPSARKPNWDYRWQGLYYVTICTRNRNHYFGNVKNGITELSDMGHIAVSHWLDIPTHFSFVEIHNFVVMPNHIHGLLQIRENMDNPNPVETLHATSLRHNTTQLPIPSLQQKDENMAKISPKTGSLSVVIRSFKSAVTRFASQNKIEFGWQSRYHDHIVRNGDEYNRIFEYIANNPANWRNDEYY